MSTFNFTVPTDKQPGGWHAAYMPIYERLFGPFRWRNEGYTDIPNEVRLLEIGTDGGGCLLAYADYFPRGKIYGIDINPTPDAIKQHSRIRHLQQDAYTQPAVHLMGSEGYFDVMIDDGPHSLESQVFFVEHYTKLLTLDGIAIVEDVQDPAHIARLTEALPPGFFGFAIDLRAVKPERYDNLLFCVVKN